MRRKKKFIIIGIIALVAIGILAYQGFAGAATYYYTVPEVLEKGSSVDGDNLRVRGQVVPGSIVDSGGMSLKFSIGEGDKFLPVECSKGAVPDTFTTATEVTVEGYIDQSGTFQAKSILTACPSRYELK